MRTKSSMAAAALLITWAFATAACSSSSSSGAAPNVASLATPTTAGHSPSPGASSPAGPPRERLDSTDAEIAKMSQPYYKCMRARGVEADIASLAKDPDAELKAKMATTSQKFLRADKFCKPRYYPLPPWENDPANPEHKKFIRAVVACLKAKGVAVEITDDGDTYGYGGSADDVDQSSVINGMEESPKCERKVAAEMKKS